MRTVASLAGVLSLVAVGAVMPRLASADSMSSSRTETTTTTSMGTVTEIAPSSSTIVLKTESSPAPVKYQFTEKTTFVDPTGAVVTQESIRNQPVTLYYSKEGESMVVNKVVVTKPSIEKKSTTTTTTEERH